MKGIDYTSQTTETQAKALKASGYGFACRYLVPASMAWKRLTKSEAEILTAVGLKILSIFESTADRAKSGSAGGTSDGKAAFSEAKLVGQPEGSTIYFAVDYDAQPKEFDTIEAYLKAAAAQIPGYNVGTYGSYAVCEEMTKRGVCKHYWQTYAWSAGKLSKHANIYQNKNGVTVAGIQCDLNDSYGNEGFWNLSIEETPSWQDIVRKAAGSPTEWQNAINAAVNAAKADGNLGTLEIFQWLPELIIKIYQCGKDGK